MVSPYLIKLCAYEVASVGRITGKVSVYLTLGSISGTFIPVFLTIPFWGTQKTIWFFALLLIVMSLVGLVKVFFRDNLSLQQPINIERQVIDLDIVEKE